MEYMTFPNEKTAKQAAEKLTGYSDVGIERLYLPTNVNANRFGNVWTVSVANPRGGRWHIQEDGHVG